MLEYLLITVLGCFAGSFTGMVPGIHPNTVIFASIPVYLSFSIKLPFYIAFIAGMVISHSFHNFLPSIALGVPEAESALAALPGARMAVEGKGHEAFLITLEGGVKSIAVLTVVSPVLFLVLKPIYSVIELIMAHIILFVIFFIIVYSGKPKSSIAIISLAGLLGILAFDSPVNQSYVLLPVFSGMFALPSILKGLRQEFEIPKQETADFPVNVGSGAVIGGLAGLMAGTLPGLGGATSTSFLSPMIESERSFLASMGAVNTSDAVISFLSLYIIDSARSGPAVALSYLSSSGLPTILFAMGISLFSVPLSVFLAYKISPYFFEYLNRIPIKYVYLVSFLAVSVFTIYFTGLLGALILVTSGFIGYAAMLRSLRKSCMAVLLLPALQFYATGLFL